MDVAQGNTVGPEKFNRSQADALVVSPNRPRYARPPSPPGGGKKGSASV
jgi:hypothetical protein